MVELVLVGLVVSYFVPVNFVVKYVLVMSLVEVEKGLNWVL